MRMFMKLWGFKQMLECMPLAEGLAERGLDNLANADKVATVENMKTTSILLLKYTVSSFVMWASHWAFILAWAILIVSALALLGVITLPFTLNTMSLIFGGVSVYLIIDVVTFYDINLNNRLLRLAQAIKDYDEKI